MDNHPPQNPHQAPSVPVEPPRVDPALLLLTPRQKAFADSLLAGKTKKASALRAYNTTPEAASQVANEIMKSDKVRAYLAERSYSAAQRIEGIAADPNEPGATRLAANKDILDRAGYKARDDEQAPAPAGNTYNILFSPEAREDVARMEAIIKARLTGAPAPVYDEEPPEEGQETDPTF